MDQDKVTIGEVYRVCMRIEARVTEQNGRVRKLEEEATRLKTFAALGTVAGAFGIDWIKHKLGW
jgi:hypothetical protein